MSEIHYVVGDATAPIGSKPAIIAHITNNRRGWGKGFVLALEAAFPGLGARWKKHNQQLADFRVDEVTPRIQIAHLCAQDGYRSKANPNPLSYAALIGCLGSLRAKAGGADIHMPRIGTGLAGGTWKVIETFIKEELVDHGIEVYVYDLPGS